MRKAELTVTGLSTYWMLPSSIRISLAFEQTSFTSASEMGSQRLSCSICLHSGESVSQWADLSQLGSVDDWRAKGELFEEVVVRKTLTDPDRRPCLLRLNKDGSLETSSYVFERKRERG